ncbi:glycosyltransferase family 2 protein [Gluconacetobacter azotocaptans]|uniref:Glycosyltransferase family 2 protein n=1 Tax=Gluconacetobacter azotocaptans TaxID=142834 RepID=A0A7W4PDV0_9PROT|nr:glycosyltransferase family 2 protein [Gluconacetobacter azotocaptans]MBB2188714.1 glycosyltransferase family 2 protein [Gluconacetobacter azotocaptans]GBQ34959.1 putative glycosyltransferase [Gluconacetobacter azotocaptans DSM 13594]
MALRVSATVPVTVAVIAIGDERRVLGEWICGQGVTTLPLGEADSRAEHLRCEIADAGADGPSIAIEWVCSEPAVRSPAIAVVICTYNREVALRRLVDALSAQHQAIAALWIVNQGDPGLAERLFSAADPSFLRVVEQENRGGAAGFTRGIIESLSDGRITHVLLMDDDVAISGELVTRLEKICAYVPDTLCIGGAMHDIADPSRLISLGHDVDRLHPAVYDRVPREGLLLGREETTRVIAAAAEVDFCGWWCLCLPRLAIERCGLPLPFFIRGDDAEYGLRLTEAGFPTVMWPGIFVEHEAFSRKARSWHHFYDRRNALLRTLLHGPPGRRVPILRLARGVVDALATYRYELAEAGIDALAAYMDGAAGLTSWGADAHCALVKRESPDFPVPGVVPVTLDRHPSPVIRTVLTVGRVLGDLPRKAVASAPVPVAAPVWISGTRQRPDAVLVVSNGRATFHSFQPARQRFLVRELFLVVLRVLFGRHPSRRDLTAMITPDWWRRFLGIDVSQW